MEYIGEILNINSDIINLKVNTNIPIISELIYKRNIKKLKKLINNISTKRLYTAMIREYGQLILENYNASNGTIKQILKGENDQIGSITFNFDMPDLYTGQVMINFTRDDEEFGCLANYVFVIYGPNSSGRFPYTEHDVGVYDFGMDIDLSSISKTDTGKVEQLKYIMVTDITENVKSFLLSRIGDMEIDNEYGH